MMCHPAAAVGKLPSISYNRPSNCERRQSVTSRPRPRPSPLPTPSEPTPDPVRPVPTLSRPCPTLSDPSRPCPTLSDPSRPCPILPDPVRPAPDPVRPSPILPDPVLPAPDPSRPAPDPSRPGRASTGRKQLASAAPISRAAHGFRAISATTTDTQRRRSLEGRVRRASLLESRVVRPADSGRFGAGTPGDRTRCVWIGCLSLSRE